MTLGEIKQVFLKHMGEYGGDEAEPSVLAQYMPEMLAYINEAYCIAMKRYAPEDYVEPLMDDGDEPLFQPAALHGILADYAAGRCLVSEPGRAERASYLLGQFQNGLFHVQAPRYRFIHRWD
jgi:hypothetical protein